LNKNVGRENISKPTIGNGKTHEDNNDKGFRIVNLPHQNSSYVHDVPHRNIHKYTWTSPDGKTDIYIAHILIDTR